MKNKSNRGMARLALCVAATAILAACGGGGGSSASSAPSTPSAPSSATSPSSPVTSPASSPVSLLTPNATALTSFSAQGSFLPDSLNYMNAVRQAVGEPALISNSGVASAAQNHAQYEATNGIVTHNETSGQPGFTGADPTARVSHYYSSGLIGEVTTSAFIVDSQLAQDSTLAIKDLVAAPFHRGNMLYCYSQAGVGSATTTPIFNSFYNSNVYSEYLNIDLADQGNCGADYQLAAYPYNGQTNVPTVWQNDEAENPLAGAVTNGMGATVGYPVTLNGFNAAQFANITFTITDPTGFVVPCAESDTSNNSANAAPLHMAACVPLLELKPNTVYTVKVTGSLSNASFAATPFTIDQWSFTTVATSNLPNTFVAPNVASNPTQPIDGLNATNQAILSNQYACSQAARAASQLNTNCNYVVNPNVTPTSF